MSRPVASGRKPHPPGEQIQQCDERLLWLLNLGDDRVKEQSLR